MGLLDYADAARKKLAGLLGDMPLVQMAQGRAEMPTMAGLLGALKGMPVFSPDAGQSAYEAALNIGPMGLGVLAPGNYKVFHGTRNLKRWYDIPEYKAMAEEGKDIPRNIAESTYPIDSLKGGPGGLKMMDGLGPHAGTSGAANERLAKNVGLPPSRAFNKFQPELSDAYILPLEANVKKPFGPPGADAYTETQLQARLSAIAKKLGYKDTRAYSSAYGASGNMKAAQRAVRDKLREEGYDAIPYINSHEDRGSISWVFLDPSILRSGLLGGSQ